MRCEYGFLNLPAFVSLSLRDENRTCKIHVNSSKSLSENLSSRKSGIMLSEAKHLSGEDSERDSSLRSE
jgi:hypothetical protein